MPANTIFTRAGSDVSGSSTSAEVMQKARLDWSVSKEPVFTYVPNPENADSLIRKSIDDKFAMLRSDNQDVLGIVGKDYTILQNADAFAFLDELSEGGDMSYETAGSFKGGRRVWALARLPESIQVADGDIVDPYMLISNSHDGTSGVTITPTTVRVVCQNTLNLAIKKGRTKTEFFTFRHTQSLESKMSFAREVILTIRAEMQNFEAVARQMVAKRMTAGQRQDYYDRIAKDYTKSEKAAERFLGKVKSLLENEKNGLPGIAGSVWAAYNSVSEFADHEMSIRGEDEAGRINSMFFGSSHRLKQRAWDLALEIVA